MTGHPKVSVCVITHEHAPFIGACLESLVGQETDFPLEILVGVDRSRDRTAEIVAEFAFRYPSLIRPLIRKRRIGGVANFLAVHNAARGEYVAHVDGDDLAAPGKLARQAALLDVHPEIVACGHRMAVISAEGEPTGRTFPRFLPSRFDLGKVVRCGMPFLNSSLMYRRSARRLRRADFEVFDWFALTDLLQSGEGACLGEELGLYRLNPHSFTSKVTRADMRRRMMTNLQARFAQLGAARGDVFASAVVDLCACLRERASVSREHRQLLRQSFDWRAAWRIFDAFAFRLLNGSAIAR